MTAPNRIARALLLAGLGLASACALAPNPALPPRAEAPLFAIADAVLPRPLTFVAYGDMRFTAPTETVASRPAVRQALIARIAAERPAALFLSGDVPWHGGTVADYAVYHDETRVWRDQSLRVYPALGNHEFYNCQELQCLENWWSTFPELRGHRWYSVALGSRVRGFALDSTASLLAGDPQRSWLEEQLAALPRAVRFVIVWLHHPPVADLATGDLADHNPRPNEIELADLLRRVAATSRARFVVVAGHTHNYEHLEQDGVVYLVSGGGGARPYPVERTAADHYQGADPNFHYIRFRLERDRLSAEMVRLEDPDATAPATFEVRDRFEIRAR